MSTETIILPEKTLQRILKAAKKFSKKPNKEPDIIITHKGYSLAALIGYKEGAEAEALRSIKLVKALRDLRHGLFSSEEDVNNLIDQTLNEYNNL